MDTEDFYLPVTRGGDNGEGREAINENVRVYSSETMKKTMEINPAVRDALHPAIRYICACLYVWVSYVSTCADARRHAPISRAHIRAATGKH